jgi:predicted RNA-binding Zn-ribbon protein involved in translation (DUF1610 family)
MEELPAGTASSEEIQAPGTTVVAGQTVDAGRGRVFPCEGCGADLRFHIGQQKLKCPYCGYEKDLAHADEAAFAENDYLPMLQRLRERKAREVHVEENVCELTCGSCAGTVTFTGTLTSTECPYCGSPVQREKIHAAGDRIPVDAVLPFMVDERQAHQKLKSWVASRWFAPNDFLKKGAEGKFNGVYLPYWTFDTMTFSAYRGERGEDYWVTQGVGDRKRRVRKTRWYPASGSFQRFFDDVLVVASDGLPPDYIIALEPWPLEKCRPFTQEVLAGLFARTYDVPLENGFEHARVRIESAISADARQRIGGDRQRLHSIKSTFDAITFKHLLLPVWMLAYRHRDQAYRVFLNAVTGEVHGERPYSWIKITLAVLAALIVGLIVAAVSGR